MCMTLQSYVCSLANHILNKDSALHLFPPLESSAHTRNAASSSDTKQDMH